MAAKRSVQISLYGMLTGLFLLFPLFFGEREGWGQEGAGPTLLENRCSGCHTPHETDGKLDSIEFERKTPEGWEMTLTRMVRLQGVQLQAGEARTLVKYLSDRYGLAPAEVEPFRYALEKRNNTVEQDIPKAVQGTCVQCHSYARIALQRRTPQFWDRMPDLTAALLPNIESQTASAGLLNDLWYTLVRKDSVPYLAQAYPFDSQAWKKWQAAHKQDYAGSWKVVGHDPGKGGDYTGRLTWPVTLKEVEAKGNPPPAERMAREGALLLAAVPAGATIVVLDGRGQALTSAAFAARLGRWRDDGVRELCFLIGGADGHTPDVLGRANFLLSLGAMTWPHMLARVMLAEQLYRAQSILTGHPYHRA